MRVIAYCSLQKEEGEGKKKVTHFLPLPSASLLPSIINNIFDYQTGTYYEINMTYFPFWQKLMALGPIWYGILSNNFQFLNNIICISTHFFTHTYF